MKRFTYTIGYQGRGPTREEFLTQMVPENGFRILAENSRYLVVETERGGLGLLRTLLPGWLIEPSRGAKVSGESESPSLEDLWDLGEKNDG